MTERSGLKFWWLGHQNVGLNLTQAGHGACVLDEHDT